MDLSLPLADLRVVELGQLLAGPFCGQLLGDFGAEVIKVEDPGRGDPMREWGREKPHGQSLWWPVVARNKQSVTCDLRDRGVRTWSAAWSPRPTCCSRTSAPAPSSAGACRPRSCGRSTPASSSPGSPASARPGRTPPRAGYGSIGEAMGGIRYVIGDPDRPPARAGISPRRLPRRDLRLPRHPGRAAPRADRTGRGPGRRLGDLRGRAGDDGVAAAGVGRSPATSASAPARSCPNVAPSNVYPTADGEIVLVAANQDTVFAPARRGHGRPGAGHRRPRYATHGARGAHLEELDDLIAVWTATHRRRRPARPPARGRRPRGPHLPGQGHARRPALRRPRGDRPAGAPRARRGRRCRTSSPALSATPGPGPSRRPRRSASTTTSVYRGLLGLDGRRPLAVVCAPPASSETAQEDGMTYRLGVDVGGTFTDVLLIDDDTGETWRAKTASTPEDQSVGVLRGIERVCADAGIAPRATSPRCCTAPRSPPTRSSRARARRSGWSPPHGLPPGAPDRPLLRPRRPGRLDHLAQARAAGRAGEHRRGPSSGSPATARSSPRSTRTTSAPSSAACKRAGHRGAGGLRSSTPSPTPTTSSGSARSPPRSCPDVPVSLSSHGPARAARVRAHHHHRRQRLRPAAGRALRRQPRRRSSPTAGVDGPLYILRSDGGLASAAAAADQPGQPAAVRPAGGVTGAAWAAEQAGFRDFLTFDMGGTSHRRRAWSRTSTRGSAGDPGRRPRASARRRVDVRTVGAGGGSIAHVPAADPGAARRARSPRARSPGPAAYGQGGERSRPSPTPTSCSATCPTELAGGEITLDVDAARAAVQTDRRRHRAGSVEAAAARDRRHRQREHVRRAAAGLACSRASTRATSPSSPSAAPARCTPTRSAG